MRNVNRARDAATGKPRSIHRNWFVTAKFTRHASLTVMGCPGSGGSWTPQVRLAGEWKANYQLEGSLDLSDWTPLEILTNVYGTVDGRVPPGPLRFLRAYELSQ